MSERTLVCFAHGRNGKWEAHCVDFDIAVQGESQVEVQQLMETSIKAYISSIADEDPLDRDRLLRRRAPWYVTTNFAIKFLWHAFRRRNQDEYRVGINMPCPA